MRAVTTVGSITTEHAQLRGSRDDHTELQRPVHQSMASVVSQLPAGYGCMGVAAGWGRGGGLSAKLKDMCDEVYAHVHM